MSDDLNKLLKKYSTEVQDLALQARELVLKTVPDAQEKVYLGWNGIHFSTSGGMQSTFCAISPQRTRINLYARRSLARSVRLAGRDRQEYAPHQNRQCKVAQKPRRESVDQSSGEISTGRMNHVA